MKYAVVVLLIVCGQTVSWLTWPQLNRFTLAAATVAPVNLANGSLETIEVQEVMEFADGYVDLGSIRLHYVEAGQGPLIVFYHGFPSYWFSFYDQMVELCKDYHVVAVDGLGANLSSKPDNLSLYKVENLAAQLDQLARHLAGDDTFILVGHDWGGALAWAYAQQYPDRLEKVVVMSAPPYNQFLELIQINEEQRTRSSYMYELRQGERHRMITENAGQLLWKRAYEPLRSLPHFSPERDERFRQALAMPGAVDGGLNWYRANVPQPDQIKDSDFWPSRKAQTSVPGLLIWGADDRTFVREFRERLSDYVPDVSIHVLPGTGHWPMIEKPETVNGLIREFLSQ